MTRRYDEPIEVTSAFADPDRADPEAFIWRGRLFVVRAVLDRWHERRVWWRETGMPDGARPPAPTRRAGVALAEPVAEASAEPVAETLAAPTGVGRSGDPTGGRRPDAPAGAGRTHAPAGAGRTGAPAGAGGGDLVDGVGLGDAAADRERQVWRVEASPGRAAGTGVFDLCSDGVGPGGSPRWVLLRTHD